MNALKHGLTAAEIILPTVEEKIDFEQFRAAFEEECQPVGAIEQVLVEDLVAARWRLNRIRKMEPGFFALRREVLKDGITEFSTLDPQAQLALIVLDDARDTDTYGKMSRYEARFERSFYKALKELQRLQALRAEVSDSGNGTVSQDPVSPAPDPPSDAISDPILPPQASAPETEPTPQPPVSPEEPQNNQSAPPSPSFAILN